MRALIVVLLACLFAATFAKQNKMGFVTGRNKMAFVPNAQILNREIAKLNEQVASLRAQIRLCSVSQTQTKTNNKIKNEVKRAVNEVKKQLPKQAVKKEVTKLVVRAKGVQPPKAIVNVVTGFIRKIITNKVIAVDLTKQAKKVVQRIQTTTNQVKKQVLDTVKKGIDTKIQVAKTNIKQAVSALKKPEITKYVPASVTKKILDSKKVAQVVKKAVARPKTMCMRTEQFEKLQNMAKSCKPLDFARFKQNAPKPQRFSAVQQTRKERRTLIGKTITLESLNYPNHFLRHRNFASWIDRPNSIKNDRLYEQDRRFVVRKGLSGKGISFESVNYPGYFLRHTGYRVVLHKRDNSDLYKKDASFIVRRSLAGRRGYLSFESVNYPSHFIRHSGYAGWIHKNNNSQLFKEDASFKISLK